MHPFGFDHQLSNFCQIFSIKFVKAKRFLIKDAKKQNLDNLSYLLPL